MVFKLNEWKGSIILVDYIGFKNLVSVAVIQKIESFFLNTFLMSSYSIWLNCCTSDINSYIRRDSAWNSALRDSAEWLKLKRAVLAFKFNFLKN